MTFSQAHTCCLRLKHALGAFHIKDTTTTPSVFLDVIVIDDCNGSLFVISLERKIKGMLGRDWKGFLKDENDDGSRVHFLYLEAS